MHRKNREDGQKNPCHGKHREFGNFAKTQGILFAQVINSLIIFIAKKIGKVLEAGYVCQVSLCI